MVVCTISGCVTRLDLDVPVRRWCRRRVQVGGGAVEAVESRHSMVAYGQPWHRVASCGCFTGVEATNSRHSVNDAGSSGDFWLLRSR